MNSLDGNKLTGAQKEELMDRVKQQVAVLLAQELLQVCKFPVYIKKE